MGKMKAKVSFKDDLTGVTLKSFDQCKVEVVSYKGRLIALVNGVLPLRVTSCIDGNGDDCAYSDAVCCVAGSDKTGWITITLGSDDGSYSGRMN